MRIKLRNATMMIDGREVRMPEIVFDEGLATALFVRPASKGDGEVDEVTVELVRELRLKGKDARRLAKALEKEDRRRRKKRKKCKCQRDKV